MQVRVVFSQIAREQKRRPKVAFTQRVSRQNGPQGGMEGPLGGALGVPWGALWGLEGAVVDPRGIHGDNLLQTGGLAKSMVSNMIRYNWALGRTLGDLGGHVLD